MSTSPFTEIQQIQEAQREGCVPEHKPTLETIKAEIRQAPLHHRLKLSQDRIGAMCKDGRGPSMSVPVRAVDDDFFIVTTLEDAARELAEKDAQILALREALGKINRWHGEFPETGRFWDRDTKAEPMSYSAAFGSNGERDFMRAIAKSALSAPPPPVVSLEDVLPLVEVLRYIAKQKLSSELVDDEQRDSADYEYGYDTCVEKSREVLSQFTTQHPLP